VQQLGAPGFYHIVARYGYAQRIQQGPEFVKVASLDTQFDMKAANLTLPCRTTMTCPACSAVWHMASALIHDGG
jgi:hypothetical protein